MLLDSPLSLHDLLIVSSCVLIPHTFPHPPPQYCEAVHEMKRLNLQYICHVNYGPENMSHVPAVTFTGITGALLSLNTQMKYASRYSNQLVVSV